MSRETVAHEIAGRVYHQESINSRMLGHDELDVSILTSRAWGETFSAMFAPDRPLVTTRFRL